MINQPQPGMSVSGSDGPIGSVDDVIYDPVGGTARVVVRRSDGPSLVLQPGSYKVQDGALWLDNADIFRTQRLELNLTNATNISNQTSDSADGELRVIPVIREQVTVGRREVEGGGVRVHKRVEQREEVVEQPTYREEVSVERVALGRPVNEPVGSRQEGDTLIIPVFEEMLVVEKRLVLKEEIRITKRRIEETEQTRIVLREEHVDIENIGDGESLA